ncbi:hypothetical protein [Streptomyces sp. NPDC002690]
MGSEQPGGTAGRHRSGRSDWLRGARIIGVHGVFYRPDGRAGGPEAVEFVLADDRSVLMTCATDCTLRVSAGTWPRLPDWCVPAGLWAHGPLNSLPPAPFGGGWTVTGAQENRDENDEVHEAVIHCENGDFVVLAGDALVIRFRSCGSMP